MAVSLDKTKYSVQYGKFKARVNSELRRNNLCALFFEFSERIYDAEVSKFEAYKTAVLSDAA